MKTIKHLLNLKNIVPVASLVSAVLLSLFVVSPVIADVQLSMDTHKNCVNAVFPDNVEHEIVVDYDAGVVFVEYIDNGIKKETKLSLRNDSKFDECTNGAKELITLAKNNAEKMNSDTCTELNEIVSGVRPVPVLDGKKMNVPAAKRYISDYCDKKAFISKEQIMN